MVKIMKIIKGDITTLDVDIVVNAANSSLLGGGGVDGAIHRKAGKELLNECRLLNGCEVGEAKMTNGYNMLCKKIIHTVGPRYRDGLHNEKELLKRCYFNCMKLAEKYMGDENLSSVSIAFPCISTGLYSFPNEEAAKIAVSTVKEFDNKNINVNFVCFLENDYNIYLNLIK